MIAVLIGCGSCQNDKRPKIEDGDEVVAFDAEVNAENESSSQFIVNGGVVENSDSGLIRLFFDDERIVGQQIEVRAEFDQGEEATTPQRLTIETQKQELSFQIDTEFLDGIERQLLVSIDFDGETYQLKGTPITVLGADSSVSGREYFQLVVEPKLDFYCSRCHQIDYETQLNYLVEPSVDEGGSPKNNLLILHPRGRLGHPGGRVCPTSQSSPCLEIERWWSRLFATDGD